MGLFKKWCVMCDTEIDFLGESEVCEKCLPFSEKFIKLKDENSMLEIHHNDLKDFMRLMLTKITKYEGITEDDKQVWLNFCKEVTSYFDYYSRPEVYSKYHSIDYHVISSVFQLFSKHDYGMLKKSGYLKNMRDALVDYREFHKWTEEGQPICSIEKALERINGENH